MSTCETEFDSNALRFAPHAPGESIAVGSQSWVGPVSDLITVGYRPVRAPDPHVAPSRHGLLFPCLWLFISFVSAYDTYLTVRFQEDLGYHEANPMGQFLMTIADGGPSFLIGAKFLGSTLVMGILSALYMRHRQMGFIVAAALAAFQLALLGYLVLV